MTIKSETVCKVLAVDDNEELLDTLTDVLLVNNYQVISATNGQEALAVAREQAPDVAILDVNMPEMDGLEATRRFKSDNVLRYIPLILLTARDSIEHIVEGLNAGADDYLRKPFEERELLARVQSALRTKAIYEELAQSKKQALALQDTLSQRYAFSNIIGACEPMQHLYRLIEKVADSDIPVLIAGESGTGKELVAKALHFNSSRSGRPFIAQNCAAFQESLLEAELFGYAKGAFTGATRDKPGLFEVANCGTLFLDEVGEMSPALQAKLLRVLQDGTFTAVGDTRVKQVNIRLVCASHKCLRDLVAQGQFREDLFYRINVVELKLPPLRERTQDIPLLVDFFLAEFAEKGMKPRVSAELMDVLMNYEWPGNVRQLQNEIRRLLVLSDDRDGIIGYESLSPQVLEGRLHHGAKLHPQGVDFAGMTLKDAIEDLERKLISSTLSEVGGNRSETARRLGISRSSLLAKMQQYDLREA